MNRRDFLVAFIEALLLALFPWMRTEQGAAAAAQAAEAFVPLDFGMWEQQAMWHLCRAYDFTWTTSQAKSLVRQVRQSG